MTLDLYTGFAQTMGLKPSHTHKSNLELIDVLI
jgi:hypothetical protein